MIACQPWQPFERLKPKGAPACPGVPWGLAFETWDPRNLSRRAVDRSRMGKHWSHLLSTAGEARACFSKHRPGRHLKCNERNFPLRRDSLSATTQEQAAESRFSPSLIRAVANTAMGRQDVLPFWFGESDQSTPPFIREAAIASLRDGETFYSENLGRPYLRQAISTYLTNLHHLPIGTDRIAVTASGVSALMLASQLLVSPGDRVVTVTPLWPNAVEIPKVMNGRVTCVSLEVQHGRWTLPLEKLLHALTPGTRMLVLNSPNNPTGWTIQRAEQVAILEHCRRHGIWIIADDVYERLVYADGMKTAPSFLTLAEPGDRLIVINSFSKAWSMTGWRLGWIVVPPSIQDDLASLLEYNTSCVPEFIQRAGVIALQEGDLTSVNCEPNWQPPRRNC